MFSTVDNRAARVLQIRLITQQGEVSVPVPQGLEKRADQLKADFSRRELTEFAKAVADCRWSHRDAPWHGMVAGAQLQASDLHTAKLRASKQRVSKLRVNPSKREPVAEWDIRQTTGVRTPWVGRKSSRTAKHQAEQTSSLDPMAVRVSVSRMRYEQTTGTLELIPEMSVDVLSSDATDGRENDGEESNGEKYTRVQARGISQ